MITEIIEKEYLDSIRQEAIEKEYMPERDEIMAAYTVEELDATFVTVTGKEDSPCVYSFVMPYENP